MDELIKANGEIVYLFGYCAVVHSSPVWKAGSVLSQPCLDPKLLSTLWMSTRCGYSCWCVRMPRHVIHSFATVMPPKHNLSGLGDLAIGPGVLRQRNRQGTDTSRIRTHRKSFSATWLIRRVLIPGRLHHHHHRQWNYRHCAKVSSLAAVGSSGVCMICINLANVVDTGPSPISADMARSIWSLISPPAFFLLRSGPHESHDIA